MKGELFARDWRALLDAVYHINQASDTTRLETIALECVMHIVPCVQGLFFIAESSTNDIREVVYRRPVVVGKPALLLDEFMSGAFDTDPYFGGLGIVSKIETFRDTDLMPEEYRMSTPLYQQVYAKQGIHYGLRSYMVHGGRVRGNISLFKEREMGDFSDKDITLVDLLAPHIALRLNELLDREEAGGMDAGGDAGRLDVALLAKFGLTKREMEVASLMLDGVDDRDAAAKLYISFATFKKHVHHIYRKTGVSNRVQLLATLQSK